MKKLYKLLLTLFLVLPLNSCAKSNKLNYEEFINKIDNKETFTFVITQNGCGGCKEYEPIIKQYNKDNSIVYELKWDSLEATEQIVLAAMTYEFFGLNYYKEYEATSTKVITPTTIKVVEGKFERGETKALQLEEIDNLINSNIITLHDFYGFTRKTANNDSFIVCFYTNEEQLSHYIQEASYHNQELYTLNLNKLLDGDISRLLGRINYFFDPTNESKTFESLEEHFQLTYSQGSIISYSTVS